jgi:methionyl-tRNA formyltransferase
LDGQENAIELSDILSKLGGNLIEDLLKNLRPNGSLGGVPQNKNEITWAKKIDKSEAIFDAETWTAEQLHNRVRAFRAWPTVKFRRTAQENELKILKTSLISTPIASLLPGQLKTQNQRVVLGCLPDTQGRNAVELSIIQAPGKGPVNGLDYFQNSLKNKG